MYPNFPKRRVYLRKKNRTRNIEERQIALHVYLYRDRHELPEYNGLGFRQLFPSGQVEAVWFSLTGIRLLPVFLENLLKPNSISPFHIVEENIF